MGLFSFLKSAGEILFGKDSDSEKASKVKKHLKGYGLPVDDLNIIVDDEKVTISGSVNTFEEKTKILVAVGNVSGISQVNDQLSVIQPIEVEIEPSKMFYTVKKGDYLSKIAKNIYGDGNKYNIIFEANKPMLKHPDKIYPGQVLVIPTIKLT